MDFGRHARAHAAALGLAMILSACGGGGGGSGSKDATPSSTGGGGDGMVTMSGTLSIVETAAVDSDTNDRNQASRRPNNDALNAQALNTPFNLVGTVNQAGAGPEGPNKEPGDDTDLYVVDLKVDQVVELEFAADAALQNDLALVLFNDKHQDVAVSNTAGNTECVRIGQPGLYYIAVYAKRGAAVYNLRVGAPGTARACQTATTPHPSTVAGQLIAMPRAITASANKDRLSAQSAEGLTQVSVPAGAPTLLTLPATARDRLKGLAQIASLSSFKRASALSQAAAAPSIPTDNIARMRDTLAYAQALMATGQYEYVDLNHTVAPSAVEGIGAFPPNDEFYPRQRWHYEQINLPAAMDRLVNLPTQADRHPLVAVIDSGIVSNHPDLAPQREGGRTFVSLNTQGDHDSDNPDDPDLPGATGDPAFHGSHVAGTIAARTFDGRGAAGVAPMAKILPLRVFDPGNPNGANDFDIIQAMRYAAGLPNRSNLLPDRKADVINLSLGGPRACQASYVDLIRQVRQAGVIVVAAAGNSAKNNSNMPAPVATPANCPGVVAVGALDAQRRQADYSQSGPELQVSAPGGDMSRSTTGNPAGDMVFSTVAIFTPQGLRQPSYSYMDGTSMASPHVAGVVALMKYAYPDLTPDKFDAWLKAGKLTDDLGPTGHDTATGYGLINARKAVDVALAEARTPGPAPQGKIVATPFSLDFGTQLTSMALGLTSTATTAEVVTGISSSRPQALSFAPVNVDAKTGLGSYTVKVDRAQLPPGTSFLTLTVQTSRDTFTVQVTVVKQEGSGAGPHSGDYGPVYVIAVDAVTEEAIAETVVTAKGGQYAWELQAPRGSTLYLVAGGDLDQNQFICDAGEPCGGYPLLSDKLTAITLEANVSGLNFALSPTSTGGTALTSLSKALGKAPATQGIRRPRAP